MILWGVCVEIIRGRFVVLMVVCDYLFFILFSLINRVIIIMYL